MQNKIKRIRHKQRNKQITQISKYRYEISEENVRLSRVWNIALCSEREKERRIWAVESDAATTWGYVNFLFYAIALEFAKKLNRDGNREDDFRNGCGI